ncbi:PIN domain-containing protein [Prosthecobacter sp.]|uniref:PIN domain-containing protein n=1 Tax=Prosthecobacter sp. TaxID=1965333 RepID=UPI0037845862
MIVSLDSSILVSSLAERERCHAACENLLFEHDCRVYSHALAETFNVLTGSRLGYRFAASDVAALLKESVLSKVTVSLLNEDDLLTAMQLAESRGVRGGAIYDFLHLVAARKAGAARFYTLNTDDFIGIWRVGDPEIAHP